MNEKFEAFLKVRYIELYDKNFPGEEFNYLQTKAHNDFKELTQDEILELFELYKEQELKYKIGYDLGHFNFYLECSGKKCPALYSEYYEYFFTYFLQNKLNENINYILYELNLKIPYFFENFLEDYKILANDLLRDINKIENEKIKELVLKKVDKMLKGETKFYLEGY